MVASRNEIIIVRRIEMWRDKMVFFCLLRFHIENYLAIERKAEKIAQIYFIQPEPNTTGDSWKFRGNWLWKIQQLRDRQRNIVQKFISQFILLTKCVAAYWKCDGNSCWLDINGHEFCAVTCVERMIRSHFLKKNGASDVAKLWFDWIASLEKV